MTAADRLRVCYLLEDTALFGGVKVVLHQANLMHARGHEVTVASRGERPDWYPLRAAFRRVARFAPEELPAADVVVATFWTTIAPAAAVPGAQALHYCQGFEGALQHNRAEHPAIERAYGAPLPAMTVSPALASLLDARFHRPARVVPPAIEPFWRPRVRFSPARRPRILVVHPFEFGMKGVRVALEAVRGMRAGGLECRLVRVSQWPLSDAERAVVAPDEFHHHLPPRAVARVLRGCDLLLAPAWEIEGFGLTVLEALASGVPVVASDIPSFRFLAGGAATLVPWDDPAAFAAAAAELLGDAARWRGARRRGRAAAARFAESRVSAQAEAALRWAREGSWRDEMAGQGRG